MGRRSRKRGSASLAEPATPRAPRSDADRPPGAGPPGAARPRRRRSRRDEAPAAPWGKFPLVELCTLTAIVIAVVGFVTGGRSGVILIATGVTLGSLAGLELSVREHFAGYRSHTTVLAGAVAVAVIAILFFTHVSRVVFIPVGAVAGATAYWLLREAFKRRSGGFGFRA